MALDLGPDPSLVSLPMELVEMIIRLVAEDKKSLPNVRLVCKLFKKLSEGYFHRAFLTQLHVAPTQKAFTRLLWTARLPELSRTIQSITIPYDNINFAGSGALSAGAYVEGEVDLFLKTLEHFHQIGRHIDLNVTVVKTPLDSGCSVISVMYEVLVYVLFSYVGHGQRGVRSISLDIDDSLNSIYTVLAHPSQNRDRAEDFGPRFQRIWGHMLEHKILEFVQVRFSKKDEKPQFPRFFRISQKNDMIHLKMQCLTCWHWDIMGRFTVFSEIHSLHIQNCIIDTSEYHELFYGSKLQHVFLHNVMQLNIWRSFDPPMVHQEPDSWEYYLVMMASCAPLQTFRVGRLHDGNGQILYVQPWIVEGTPERSVSRAIFEQYP